MGPAGPFLGQIYTKIYLNIVTYWALAWGPGPVTCAVKLHSDLHQKERPGLYVDRI